jgi:hypothetical protein
VTDAVMAVLRGVRKVAAGAASAALVTGLGLPALGGLVFLAVLVLGAACWVIGSQDRTERVSRVLLAWRGNAGCLARDGAVSPPAPALLTGPAATPKETPFLCCSTSLRRPSQPSISAAARRSGS